MKRPVRYAEGKQEGMYPAVPAWTKRFHFKEPTFGYYFEEGLETQFMHLNSTAG